MSKTLTAVLLGMLDKDFEFHPHAPKEFKVKRVVFWIDRPAHDGSWGGPDIVLYADGVGVERSAQWAQMPGLGTLEGIPNPLEKLRQRVERLRVASVRDQQSEKRASVLKALQS